MGHGKVIDDHHQMGGLLFSQPHVMPDVLQPASTLSDDQTDVSDRSELLHALLPQPLSAVIVRGSFVSRHYLALLTQQDGGNVQYAYHIFFMHSSTTGSYRVSTRGMLFSFLVLCSTHPRYD